MMPGIMDFFFGSRLGQVAGGAILFAALVAWWQIDRAMIRSSARETGRLEERVQTQEAANDVVRRAGVARDRARARDDGLQLDPFFRD